jgi:cytochrome o ubiquinol oxidase subunit 3
MSRLDEAVDIRTTEPDVHKEGDVSMPLLGFWIYLMTDCVLFASLFATFVVLRDNTAGGPAGSELFSLPFVLTETMILLTSSFTCGLMMLAANRHKLNQTLAWLSVTFLLGTAFVTMELHEFGKLSDEGNGWGRSSFLSGFFTLVGTHGAHITVGLIWIFLMMLVLAKRGIGTATKRQLAMLSMFWHFLDLVWIFIFTVVYLMGANI